MAGRKKNQLVLEIPETSRYYRDAVGIISESPAWKLIWELNRALSIDLAYSKDDELNGFDAYTYEPEADSFKIQVIVNKSGRKYFLPEAKAFTYILTVTGGSDFFSPDEIIKKLKALSCVQFSAKINLADE